MTDVLIEAGRRTGHGQLDNEAEIREAIAGGSRVFAKRNGVYFRVDEVQNRLVYTALAVKPVGL